MGIGGEALRRRTRRHFFRDCRIGLGALALAGLLDGRWRRAEAAPLPMAAKPPPFPAKADRVIYLFMAGGPSQLELFDHKPKLQELDGTAPPDALTKEKRFAFLKKDAKLLGTRRRFTRCGRSGAEISELLPHIGSIADEICIVKSLRTDVFNHGPAKLFVNTGSPQFGRPSMGSWVTYGIGSESHDLPGFVVLQSGPRGPRAGATLWSSGFLPTTFQGVPFRAGAEPILNLRGPAGIDAERQRGFHEAVRELNALRHEAVGDAEIATRIASYELAYRMQSSAPELIAIDREPASVLEEYGATPGTASFANNCLLARRMVERGVRFVQLYHTDWDHHGAPGQSLESDLDRTAREVDRPSAALIRDLKRRGLLDRTLVIWGGEFGRTPMGEARETTGRDHHIDAYTMWFAGGGARRGATVGSTDELGFAAAEEPVHVHDIQATVLALLGLDHEALTFRFQGRDFRLTDIHGRIIDSMLA
jgi:hypothetical protein